MPRCRRSAVRAAPTMPPLFSRNQNDRDQRGRPEQQPQEQLAHHSSAVPLADDRVDRRQQVAAERAHRRRLGGRGQAEHDRTQHRQDQHQQREEARQQHLEHLRAAESSGSRRTPTRASSADGRCRSRSRCSAAGARPCRRRARRGGVARLAQRDVGGSLHASPEPGGAARPPLPAGSLTPPVRPAAPSVRRSSRRLGQPAASWRLRQAVARPGRLGQAARGARRFLQSAARLPAR